MKRYSQRWWMFALAVGVMTALAAMDELQAGPVNIPNASFESPATTFVSINIDSWQKAPKPDWFTEDPNDPTDVWANLIGVFKNTPPGSADHIDNCDGNQAIWLFARPDVGLFQDYDSVDWNDPAPTHAFNPRFQVGKSYQLTVGVIGTGGGMLQGATLELSVYYRDAASNQVVVGANTLTNLPTVFSNNTHFVDCRLEVPAVKATDAWAGQHLGVRFLSTVSSNLQGGYWDLDNVRLREITPPVLSDPVWTNNQFAFRVQSEPGLSFEVLASTNVSLPLANWTGLGTINNGSGTASFVDTSAPLYRRFYRVRQVP